LHSIVKEKEKGKAEVPRQEKRGGERPVDVAGPGGTAQGYCGDVDRLRKRGTCAGALKGEGKKIPALRTQGKKNRRYG